ncbi:hypothetical protein BH09PSE4_BH09PSE4_22820 [soil metagenome]
MFPDRRIDSTESALTLFAPISGEGCEIAAFAYLDPKRRLLGLRHIRSPHDDAIEVEVRAIAADAIAFGATAMVMAHNHPSGDCSISRADIAFTKRLSQGMEALGVRLCDHLVLARNDYSSFVERGYL